MADYKKMYYHLFNAVTDAVKNLDSENNFITRFNAADSLKRAQQECEEMFIESDEPILDFPKK